MTGMDEFVDLFGTIALDKLIALILAFGFLIKIYGKVKEYFNARMEKEEEIKESVKSIASLQQKQKTLDEELKLIQGRIEEVSAMNQQTYAFLTELKDSIEKRARNRLRDRLLQQYRYYTNLETNPDQTWTRMESDAFWASFNDYEESGGNGHMHTVVQPAMNKLKIIEI